MKATLPLIAALLLPAPITTAATRIWTGDSLFNRWTSPANWSPQGTPLDGESLHFPASAGWKQNICDISSSVDIRRLTVQGAYRFTDDTGLYGRLVIMEGITADPLAGATVIDRNVLITGDADFQCGTLASLELKRKLWLGGHTLTVTGGGTVMLTGQRETYGYITKNGTGELVINGSSVPGQLVIATVNAGTLRAEGAQQELTLRALPGGRITGDGTVSHLNGYGGVIAPGGPAAGTLTGEYVHFGVPPEFPQPSVLEIGLHGLASLGMADRLVMHDGYISNVELRVTLAAGFTPDTGTVFMPVEKLAAGACGAFTGLPQGSTFSSGGRTFLISYTGGDGNDVTLTVVPPPAQITKYLTLADGTQRLQATGEPGRSYHFQRSSDLTLWTTLETVTAAPFSGIILCEDHPSHTIRRSFYRLLTGQQP